MLAPLGLQPTPTPERVYSGFPRWLGLLVEPNRETKSADWLIDNTDIHPYLPTYSRVIRRRAALSTRRLCAAIPGMMFVPEEMMNIARRDEVFRYAHIRGVLKGTAGNMIIPKSEIAKVQAMEAKLNLPPEAKGVLFKMRQRIRFVCDLFDSWGQGTIVEIASETRIGVEVDYLFGRKTKIYVPAFEIEAL